MADGQIVANLCKSFEHCINSERALFSVLLFSKTFRLKRDFDLDIFDGDIIFSV